MNATSQITMSPSSAQNSVGSLLDSSSASADGPSFAGVLQDTAPKITRKGSDSKPDHSPPGGANLPDSGNSQPPPAAQSPPTSAATPPPRDSSTAAAAPKADNAVKRTKSTPASATSTLPTPDASQAIAGPQTALTAAQSIQVAQAAKDAQAAAAAGTAGTHRAPATQSTAAAQAVATTASNPSSMKGVGTAASALPATIKAGANDGTGAGSSSASDGTASPTPVAADASATANATSMTASTDGGFAASLAANGATAIAPGAKTGAAGRSISPSPVAGLDVLAGTANGSLTGGAVTGAGPGVAGIGGAAGLGGAAGGSTALTAASMGALAAARLAQIQGSARHAADSTGGASFSLDGSGAGTGSGVNATTPGDGSAALAQLTSGSAVSGATDTSSASSAVLRVHANVDSAAFPGALTERVSYMVGHDLSSAKLSVNPPSLGPIEVNISVQGDHAHVSMASHSAVTREALQATAPQLKDMLSTQGFGQVSVDISQRSFQERSSHAQPYERQSGPLDVNAASTSAVVAASGLAPRAASSALDAYA